MRWTIATGFIAITALAAAVAVPAAATGAAAPPEHAAAGGLGQSDTAFPGQVPVVPDWTSAGQNISGRPTDLLGIGQKSGIYWALNPWTGDVVWRTQVGPGGDAGGIEWGAATDGNRIYVAIADSNLLPYAIVTSPGHTVTINGGSWSALDAATGKILWQTADPEHAPDFGFVSTANGVVYAGSAASAGRTMYALDAANGAVLWQFASGGSVVSGAAIVGGSVYWGSGDYMPEGVVANDKLYAFSIPHP